VEEKFYRLLVEVARFYLDAVELSRLVAEDARRVIDATTSDMFCGLMQCTVYACKSWNA
jgi:hypothetical protein